MIRKSIKRKTASIYVDYYFRHYNINKKVQPNLKESILRACENPGLEISSKTLNLDETNRICVNDSSNNPILDISKVDKSVSSITSFVEFIVGKIMELEDEESFALRIFYLERKMDVIEDYLKSMGIHSLHFASL